MQISNNNPTSFGSIQVGISKMTRKQRIISNRLFDSIKYSAKYSKLTSEIRAGEDLDIYILPNNGKGIEVRFIDPYSGNFVKKDNKIIRENLFSTVSDKVESVTDKIVETYEKIVLGKIIRPKEDIQKFKLGQTDIHRINPKKAEDLSETINEYKHLGFKENDAEELAFEEYKNVYHINNKDADF